MFRYQVLNTKEVEILGYEGTETQLVIPMWIHELPVTSIADYAFENSLVLHIELPLSVTRLGAGAFRFSKLKSINLENIMWIGEEAFRGTLLESARLPDDIHLDNGTFLNCHRLYSVSLPNTIDINILQHFDYNLREVHYRGSETECRHKLTGRINVDEPVFYFLKENGVAYKEVLGIGKCKKSGVEFTVHGDGLRIDYAPGKQVVMPSFIHGDFGFDHSDNNFPVIEIGPNAFDIICEEIWLPNTVKKVHKDAFAVSKHLQKISLAFNTNISNATLPNGEVAIETRME